MHQADKKYKEQWYPKIEYEKEEHGRKEEVLLWEILNSFSPNWELAFPEAVISFFVQAYNLAHEKEVDINKILFSVDRLKGYKNKPTKTERAHTLFSLGLTYSKIKKIIKGSKSVRELLENEDPFQNKIKFCEDLYYFNRFLIRTIKDFSFKITLPHTFRNWEEHFSIDPLVKGMENDIIGKDTED